jgi:hypothetical protein
MGKIWYIQYAVNESEAQGDDDIDAAED